MKYTNKLKLPNYIVDWLTADDYDHNLDPLTLSATTLMKPVRAYWLTLRHSNNLSMDVSELISSKLGNAIHDSIEKVQSTNVSKEQRISKQIEIDGVNYTISGKYDVLVFENNKWTIRDIKSTSVWAYIFGGKDEDYQKQLSIYRWLLHGRHEVEPVAFIDFIFTDWQSMKAKTEDNYPPQRIHTGYKIDLLSLEDTEKYLRERLKAFFQYKNVSDEALPFCTKEELWASDDSFAVMKPDAKRATKVCASQEEAVGYIADKKIEASIEFRQGKVKRCKYCSAAPTCSQFKDLQKHNLIDYF